ncbi:MAG: AbrB/MazE/SpoVT family DNA-binding domain-containing protein [Candidatus Nanoarchaeia archaeon]|nr:AbrB/MazE/SpoVT family DNA-binding domain-containing protein [Candidatus Nanoarchaeia archaeon]
MEICPICEKGKLKPVKEKHVLFGVDLGTYPGEKCSECGELFTDSKYVEKIEKIAKEKGIWGIGQKTKISKSGNSLAVRIPKKLAEYLKLKEGKEAYIHPQDRKLIIELE